MGVEVEHKIGLKELESLNKAYNPSFRVYAPLRHAYPDL